MAWAGWSGMSAPVPHEEAERLAALKGYDVLDTPDEESFDRITRLVTRVLHVPTALVSLVDEDRQWLKSCVGLPGVRETGRNVSFCAHTILRNDAMIVPDATQDARFADNPLVTGWPHIRFYMGVPLRTSDGRNVGSLCAIDSKPHFPSNEDVQTLRELAAVVVDELELRKALRESEAQKRLLAHSEAHYRDLAESIQGMVFHAIQRGPQHFEYEYVSLGSFELFGLFPEQIVADRHALRRLLHADDVESVYSAIAQSLRTGTPWQWKGRFVLPDGGIKWVHGIARGSKANDGTTHWRGVFLDTTDAERREQSLHEAKAAADRAVRAKGEFLSRMSHELRTPLNAILGFAHTLAMEPLEPEAMEDVAEIKRAGEHLLGLINEVLALAKTESVHAPDPTSVCDALTEVYGLLRSLIDERGLRLRAVHRCGYAYVRADAGKLKQAFINLMTNAIKYNRPGGGIRTTTALDNDGWVTIAIADEGMGIAPESIERLFTPFDRLGVEASGVEGTGLGLAITQGLVEAMGGTLSVTSEVGRGSTFTLRLPTVPPPEEDR